MKCKCKVCKSTMYTVDKGQERICDDCWQYREDQKEEIRLLGLEIERNKQKFIAQGLSEEDSELKALLLI